MEKRAAYESVLPYVREWIDYKVWQLRLPGVQVAIGFETRCCSPRPGVTRTSRPDGA